MLPRKLQLVKLTFQTLEKDTDCRFSHQLALSFEYTHGFGSRENISLSSRNVGMFMHGVNNKNG